LNSERAEDRLPVRGFIKMEDIDPDRPAPAVPAGFEWVIHAGSGKAVVQRVKAEAKKTA
jgi:hypothetical protein